MRGSTVRSQAALPTSAASLPQDGGSQGPAVLPPFQHYLHLVSVDPGRNRARFYRLQWHPTLWEESALLCSWGRIGTTGRAKVLATAPSDQAEATIAQLVRRRLHHGYQLVDWR